MEDRYEFLRTTEHEGKVVALIGDRTVLGEAGIKSMRMAFNVHAAPRSRQGVLTLTAEQLQERLPELESHGLKESAAAYRRAIECISKKQGGAPIAIKSTPLAM